MAAEEAAEENAEELGQAYNNPTSTDYPGVAHLANGNFTVQSLWSNYYRRYCNNGCLYPAND